MGHLPYKQIPYTLKLMAEIISNRRLELKLSRQQVSDLSNARITINDLCIYEKGKALPSLKKLEALVKVLNLNFQELKETFYVDR